MFEVELKARVDDRARVAEVLNSFARAEGTVEKSDVYWGTAADGKKVQARIRTEKSRAATRVLFTYKQKELRQGENAVRLEVNDERECELSDPGPLEAFFSDAGLRVLLEKQKSVVGWHFEDAHIELCAVPPLGDFLEIEIMSASGGEAVVSEARRKILSIFARCGIGEDKIESRYYSELLRAAGNRMETSPALR